ncbi:LamG-like jellyroll fold domain-containing protein [Hymenobacter metallilatus]|uniref:Fibronectin type-III domain-containing protein n=1 Tax=Hymenobacter metallilatus TaxID=2493666 RepID=A0A3R9LVT9_9BACT|nr:LamG-like jellyroll fold domain-containing protein [Hymenobacter metallilatus]RSK25244.1 hypothetical protein EI290_17640 [Hymenobacter metallilatus]
MHRTPLLIRGVYPTTQLTTTPSRHPAWRSAWLLLLLLLTSSASAWAANPVLLIQGTGNTSADVTAFVDLVEIVRVSDGIVISGAVTNPSFESYGALGNGSYGYAPAGASWAFNSRSGIALNGGGFGAPITPNGSAVAFVQSTAGTANGQIQQTLTLGTGQYRVRFQVAQRNCCSSNNQNLNVYIDGVLVGSIQPANDGTYATFTSTAFTVDPPAVTSLAPVRNAKTAAAGSNVQVGFSQNINSATASTIRVFSAQAGGRKAGTYSTSGSTVTFDPSVSFEPGETVFTSIPATVTSTGGAATTNKQVYQFTTAAGGSGRGNFPASTTINGGFSPRSLSVGDVNGDGNLDLLTAGSGNTVNVLLGNGAGGFTAGTAASVPISPNTLALGDLDADGDLDIMTGNFSGGQVSVRLNNGSGTFSGGQDLSIGTPYALTLGDVDADGDLDALVVNFVANNSSITVLINSGSGSFSSAQVIGVSSSCFGLTLGDVDADGDLDLLAPCYNSNSVAVRLNDGSGSFSGSYNPGVGTNPGRISLGDLDGDGDLDMAVSNLGSGTVSIRLNSGTGLFAANQEITVSPSPQGITLGDLDSDGDLDLATANFNSSPNGTASIRFNNGSGTFSGTTNLALGGDRYSPVLADIDNDGDLDLFVGNNGSTAVELRLNQPPAPTITSFSPNPAGAGLPATLTGTNLAGATALTINGAAATILTNTATSITFRVPAGATATGTSLVTTPGGTVTSTAFVFLPPPGNALAFDGTDDYVRMASTLPATAELTLEAWVNPAAFSGSLDALIMADNFPGQAMHCQFYGNNLGFSVNGNSPVDVVSTTALPTGRWSHVAVVYSASARTVRFYVNGVLNHTGTYTTAVAVAATPYSIGSWLSGSPQRFFNGKLDEVRMYTAALTQAQVQADMLSTTASVPASLSLYLSFDQGAAGGNNAGLTTLYDQSNNAFTGTLTNFALTGTTTSNYLESYALVVPTATAATTIGSTGFTATWTAPAVGTVTSYVLDYSTSATFASGVSTLTPAAGATSQPITGLTASTTYYYRLRADKTSVSGQGAYSGTISAATCAAPVAVAQNVTVTLNASGAASVAATAVNNGSTANCGPATPAALSLSTTAFSCADAVPAGTNAALSFNGTTQYVQGTNANLPLGNAARTLEAWVYPTAAGANGVIFNYGTPTINQRSGLLINGGRLYYVGENNDLRGNVVLTVNAWNHVAATYDGVTLKLYVNGALDVQLNPSAFNTTGTTWRMAQRSFPQANEFLTGRLDEVRVWNVARTAAQISTARAASLPGSTSGLVAYYRLNEGSGATVTDASASNSPGTLFSSPNWLTPGAPVTPGLPVTLTVTDASGATSTAQALVAVTDNTAPAAAGSGPLPAAPALATSNVPEAGNYGVLYQLNIPNAASFNGLSSIPYAVNNSGVSIARPARVAYFMELQSGGVTKWVWASMDNFASTLAQLGMPNPTANNVAWNQNVSNLNVFASSNAGVTTGTSLGTGRLEMWTTDYQPTNASNVPGASGSLYDFGDLPAANRNYGSFQVHNVTNAQTLLAYNNWGSNGDGGGIGDLGIGSQVGGSGHPDWTFAYNASTYTVKRLYILVPNNSAFTQPASLTLSASGTATLSQSQVYTGATDNCAVSSVVITPATFTCAQVGTPQTVTVAVSDASGNTTTQSAFVTVSVPATPTTTWNGSASSAWTDCANWSYGKVPDAATSVVIPAGLGRYPSLPAGTYTAQNLTIASGATLATAGGATLQIHGDWINNGTATLAGPVVFTGSAATQTLGGTTATGFTTVSVNKASGLVQLAQNMPVGVALTLSSGSLLTDSYQVALGSTATLSETATSYVTGIVATTRALAPGATQSFGGLGLRLTPAAGSVSPGSTVVLRTTGTALSGQGTSKSISRYYDIQPTTNAGLEVTVELGYLDAELNGITETDLGIFRSSTGTSGPWDRINVASASPAANTVTATGVEHFSIWTLGARSNPLPVKLTDFTAERQGADALLRWATAQELNNAYFEVESSADGRTFRSLGRVAGQGSSTQAHAYSFRDAGLSRYHTPLVYYRLRQVDANGTASFSQVRTLAVGEVPEAQFAVYPTLAEDGAVSYQYTGPATAATVEVLNAVGQVVRAQPAVAPGTPGRLSLTGLPRGLYHVRYRTAAGQQQARCIVP